MSYFQVENFRKDDKFTQPRSQSSSAISDVTSPVKLVGKIRGGRLVLSHSVLSLLW